MDSCTVRLRRSVLNIRCNHCQKSMVTLHFRTTSTNALTSQVSCNQLRNYTNSNRPPYFQTSLHGFYSNFTDLFGNSWAKSCFCKWLFAVFNRLAQFINFNITHTNLRQLISERVKRPDRHSIFLSYIASR